MKKKSRTRTEFGDFQTPLALAQEVCVLLAAADVSPASIIEPTCGQGNFLVASASTFESAQRMVGVEINSEYARHAEQSLRRAHVGIPFEIINADFFSFEWEALIRTMPRPLLIIGNPPWVTNTELGTLQSSNLPDKSNFQDHRGIDAITGKGNFDISEFMLLCNLQWLENQEGILAVLCKTAVARKILRHAWQKQLSITKADIHLIDAGKHFSAAVDACLLIIELSPQSRTSECVVHSDLTSAGS